MVFNMYAFGIALLFHGTARLVAHIKPKYNR